MEHCMQELPNTFRYPLIAGAKKLLFRVNENKPDNVVIGHAKGNITSGTCFHVLFFSIFVDGN